MKRIYIDPVAVNQQVALANQGEAAHGVTGYVYDQHDQPYVLFLATDKDTGAPVTDKNGKLAFNIRPSRNRK